MLTLYQPSCSYIFCSDQHFFSACYAVGLVTYQVKKKNVMLADSWILEAFAGLTDGIGPDYFTERNGPEQTDSVNYFTKRNLNLH